MWQDIGAIAAVLALVGAAAKLLVDVGWIRREFELLKTRNHTHRRKLRQHDERLTTAEQRLDEHDQRLASREFE